MDRPKLSSSVLRGGFLPTKKEIDMEPIVTVECLRQFDPPMIFVSVSAAGQYIYSFTVPYTAYSDVANALNLPGNPCQGA